MLVVTFKKVYLNFLKLNRYNGAPYVDRSFLATSIPTMVSRVTIDHFSQLKSLQWCPV